LKAVNLKNAIFWDVIIVRRISKLGTTLAITCSVLQLLVIANVDPTLLMM
jgi:hypothetical protein